ncbi:MAG: formylglycine-generating enzyme family protein, partial [bacterium]|nr:formylglycine-generating enzyme family protein [bacterium]
VAILTEQQPKDKAFPVVERALAGNLLAVLGDPRPGVRLRKDGLPDIEWCEVPAGEFLMGEDEDLKESSLPAFHISRYPVTNAQYRAFIGDGGYSERWKHCWTDKSWNWRREEHISEPDWWGGEFDLPNHPVVGVSWYEATAYCVWFTERLQETGSLTEDRKIRLPNETEWEKAARGPDGRIYPWGNEIDPEFANYNDTDLGATSAVGCFPRGQNRHGCEEMAGNVWEWCQDLYDSSGSGRVIRGGYWRDGARHCRAAFRSGDAPGHRSGYIGFRLLRTPL